MAIIFSLTLMTGCVAYVPYSGYSAGPYGGGYGYGYGVAPMVPVPVPMFHGGWRHGGFGHHRH
jgi:hypothetical protein